MPHYGTKFKSNAKNVLFLLIIYICGQQIPYICWGEVSFTRLEMQKVSVRRIKSFRQDQDQVYFYFQVNIPWFASTISCPFVLTTYKYKEKQKVQILILAKRWIGHFVSRSYQELVSFRAPSTLPLANIMSPALSVNFEKHCSQQSLPDFKLYLGELFSCFLSIWIFFIPINMAPGQIHLSICSKNEYYTRTDRKGSFNVWSGSDHFFALICEQSLPFM